jgi:Sulfotransferase domain
MTTQGLTGQEWRPNLFIAGFNKCGTTELCDYLSQHPDIFLPFDKEPNTFWDSPEYPPYFTGIHTGYAKYRRFSNIDEYYEMFSKGKKYRYRIDGTVSYTFDPKFSRILKSFSENAKVILLIRDQTHRLASMYFFSFLRHKENDFVKWLNDYFIPYIETYLYYDKIAAYYHEFGDNNNLRLIETKNLSSEDVHKQIFEYLELKPIKISVRHKNPNLLGPADSKAYRQLIFTLTSIKIRTLEVAQRIGLGKEASRASYVIGDLARELFKKRRHDKEKNSYSSIIKLIPDTISSILDEDYRKTLDFAVQNRIMIRPQC